jgi:Na+-transporting NADH:ubiquinone oxidoreductase subunit B
MKFLRNLLDTIKPQVQKGGRFEKFHSTFEAFESFLFVPGKTSPVKGTHIHDANDMKRSMSMVIVALLPALLFGMWNIGYQHAVYSGEGIALWPNFWFGFLKMLPLIIVSYGVGLGIEFISAQMRGHEVNEGFLVTGLLIPMIMPVDVPLWILAIATAFSVIFVKEIFGGTGMNIWNPALMARAFVFFAYPSQISGDKVWVSGMNEGMKVVDGLSGATPLAMASGAVTDGSTADQLIAGLPSLWDMFLGIIPGSACETSTLAILLGALFLLFVGVSSWRITLSVFLGGAVMGLLFNLFGGNAYMQLPFYYHFVMGGFAFGAVFMATDPVSAAQTRVGKWWYGFLIGMLAVLIRVLNPAYPEGMMLAILLLNTFAPLIDHFVIEANINRRLKRSAL